MNVFVAGQKRFGRDTLSLILSRGWKVSAVYAPSTDRDQLRIEALNRRLPLIEATRFTADIVPRGTDLIVAAHCHAFISRKARLRSKLGALGYHPSLLPMRRGRSAIEWAIRFRERITGGTVYWFNDVVDGGPIAAQDWCFIPPRAKASDLWKDQLAPMGLRLFEQVFDDLECGVRVAEPQDSKLATWEPAIDEVPPLWRPDLPLLGKADFVTVPDRRLREAGVPRTSRPAASACAAQLPEPSAESRR